jgi:hypothetical protein
MHYISYENLYNAVLKDIRTHILQANLDEETLLNQIHDSDSNNAKNSIAQLKTDISFNQKRIQTLDIVISKLYEDHAIEKVDDKRFRNLLKGYEEEQENLKVSIEEKSNKIIESSSKTKNINQFIRIIRKYSNIEALDSRILNEFIDKIIIHEPIYEEAIRKQRIDIHYKFIGKLTAE